MSKTPVRILLTGGGTIGHVTPVIAVVEALQSLAQSHHLKLELRFIGHRKGVEQAVIERAGLPYLGISGGKLRRYADFQNLVDPFRVMIGFFQALGILAQFRPDVLFAKGGYVSLPVVMAAALLRIPIVAHETDSILGLSNRIAARVATTLCVAFPVDHYQHQLLSTRLVHTGNPVRAEFFGVNRPIRTRPPFTVVVFGGSQGSLSINRAIELLIRDPLADCSLIHLTGRTHFRDYASRASTWYHPIDYTDHLADLLQHADVVVARAGGSVFELAAAGRPTILIPLSSSANRHQQSNAQYFAARQAAVVIDESELTPVRLRREVRELLADAPARRALSRQIRSLARPKAATQVATEILKAAGQPVEAAAE